MRIATTALILGLAAIVAASLLIRDSLLVAVLSIPIVAATFGISIFGVFRRSSFSIRKLSVVLLGVLPLAYLGLTNTPFKAAFAFLEPEFDKLGQQLQSDNQPAFPRWVGPFRVLDGGIRKNSGDPYLMTGGQKYEITGFVRHPKGEGFNLWSITTLGENWSYITED